MSRHRVIRQFPGCTSEVGGVIDTSDAPARNIASLVERRFLERVPDDTPVVQKAQANVQPQSARGQRNGQVRQ